MTTENYNIIRMERSVTYYDNLFKLHDVSGDQVAASLLVYICCTHQYNIFGFGSIDLDEFSKTMNYNQSYLYQHPEKPYQNEIDHSTQPKNRELIRKRTIDTDQSTIAYNSRFENAMYILANCTLEIKASTVYTDKYTERVIQPVKVFKWFALRQYKKNGRITYYYELDESFRNNLANYYLKMNLASFLKLRRANLAPLYFHILRTRDALFHKNMTQTPMEEAPQFDYLCKLAGIKIGENKYKKKALNQAIKRINDNTEVKVHLEWKKKNSRYNYTPILMFFPTKEEEFNMQNERLLSLSRKEERIDVAVTEFLHQLVKNCPLKNSILRENETAFITWIKNNDDIFISRIKTCLADTYANIGSSAPENIGDMVNIFVEKAQTTNNLDSMKQWLRELLYISKTI